MGVTPMAKPKAKPEIAGGDASHGRESIKAPPGYFVVRIINSRPLSEVIELPQGMHDMRTQRCEILHFGGPVGTDPDLKHLVGQIGVISMFAGVEAARERAGVVADHPAVGVAGNRFDGVDKIPPRR